MAAARDLDPTVLQMIINDWQTAKHGDKRRIVEKWAGITGVSTQTIYRALPSTRERKKGERKIDGIEDATRIVAMLKYSAPEHRGIIPTRDALENALLNNLIDKRFSDIPAGTFDRVIRELEINPQRRRVVRFQAERPNEMHHVDASSSDCFYVAEELPDNDYLLRLHKGHRDYKNKPIPVDGLRPWYYGVVDDHSGVFCARMIAARGESSAHNIDFLCWAWAKADGKALYGLPDKIKGDLGPMMRDPAIKDFFGRLGMDIDPSIPGDKEAHGKIEVSWSKIWRSFEKAYFMESNWKGFTITMSELMQRFYRWVERYNNNSHRFERKLTKKQAWERINLHGGAVIMPADALKTIVRRWPREVKQDGTFSIDNELYEVKALHDASVWVYRGVFDDKMVVVDRKDGRKYEVENFAPNKLGEFTAAKESGYHKTRKDAEQLEGVQNLLYTEQHQAMLAAPATTEPRKIVKMPTRVKEVRQLHNPLNIDRYNTIDEALAELQSLVGFFFAGPERSMVAELIQENGMSRRYVAELAGEIQAEQMRASG